MALLRVLDGFFERGARDAQAARRHIEPLGFEPGHHLLESLSLLAANQIGRRERGSSRKCSSQVSTVL